MPDLIWEIDDQDGVFLTFDDGPTPGVTEWILSTLDKYDAKATFLWDIISRDYNRKLSPRTCLRNVTKYLAPGAIVVFHDSEKAFRNMRYALPRTLEKIRQMGLKCKAIEF